MISSHQQGPFVKMTFRHPAPIVATTHGALFVPVETLNFNRGERNLFLRLVCFHQTFCTGVNPGRCSSDAIIRPYWHASQVFPVSEASRAHAGAVRTGSGSLFLRSRWLESIPDLFRVRR